MTDNISTINTLTTSTLISSFFNNSTIPGAAYNEQPSDSLSSSYIALIISLIGLCSTIFISYNIKNIKICCIKFECIKKEIDTDKCNTECIHNHHHNYNNCNEHHNEYHNYDDNCNDDDCNENHIDLHP
jgi:short subunit fatty acids transporter